MNLIFATWFFKNQVQMDRASELWWSFQKQIVSSIAGCLVSTHQTDLTPSNYVLSAYCRQQSLDKTKANLRCDLQMNTLWQAAEKKYLMSKVVVTLSNSWHCWLSIEASSRLLSWSTCKQVCSIYSIKISNAWNRYSKTT